MATQLTWFGFAGYPEIWSIKLDVCADTRPGKFIGTALCADVIVGDFHGCCHFTPGTPESRDLKATLTYAKACVDYQRKRQRNKRQPA